MIAAVSAFAPIAIQLKKLAVEEGSADNDAKQSRHTIDMYVGFL